MNHQPSDAFEVVCSGFYRQPMSEIAVVALIHAFDSQAFDENPDLLITFLKIADHHPEFKTQLRQLREELVDQKSRFVIDAIINPPDTLKPSLLLPERVAEPEGLDSYWLSFLVTGDSKFLRPIVDVLDSPDLARSLLNESIESPDSAPLQIADSQWQSLADLGIPFGVTDEKPFTHITGVGDVGRIKGVRPLCFR